MPHLNAIVYIQGMIPDAGAASKSGDVLILGLIMPVTFFEALYFYLPPMSTQVFHVLKE